MPGDPGPALEAELLEALRAWLPTLSDLAADTPLFESGRLDSMALLNLVIWIEERSGHAVDVAGLDPAAEWPTVTEILRYVERRRGAP